MSVNVKSILALDVGEKRIGVAHLATGTTMAFPLITLRNDSEFWPILKHLLTKHNAGILVVGLPRGIEGQTTAQTNKIQSFCQQLKQQLDIPVYMQDEAGTSVKARESLTQQGKPFEKEAVDALAASYILQDFIDNNAQIVNKLVSDPQSTKGV